jgi:hypothetical protein
MSIFLGEPEEKHRHALAKLVAGGELIPVMNNTKWRELIAELRAGSEFNPKFRAKDVFGADGYISQWDGELHYHIHPVQTIEWLELRSSSSNWLFSFLTKHSIPFSLEGGIPRIWGYTRPGQQPMWHVAEPKIPADNAARSSML